MDALRLLQQCGLIWLAQMAYVKLLGYSASSALGSGSGAINNTRLRSAIISLSMYAAYSVVWCVLSDLTTEHIKKNGLGR